MFVFLENPMHEDRCISTMEDVGEKSNNCYRKWYWEYVEKYVHQI